MSERMKRQVFFENGKPAGGCTWGPGWSISWQRGPMVGSDGNRLEPNGAFVEDIIRASRA